MGAPKHPESFDPARRRFLLTGTAAAALTVIGARHFGLRPLLPSATAAPAEHFEVMHTDAEWRAMLSPGQYDVLRQQGTERAFTSPLDHEKRAGTFRCAGCANDLFASTTKFESGTGWPSFYKPLANAVNESSDASLGMERTEIHCRRCGGHLGHVFDDGPPPTGLRYCMNGIAMTFAPTA